MNKEKSTVLRLYQMNTKHADFSFEESLKYIDELVAQLKDESPLPVCDTLTKDDLLPKTVAQAHATVMMVRLVADADAEEGKLRQFVYHATVNLMMAIMRSIKTLRHLDVQADGSIMAMFDTPMKKDVVDIINLSAQVRSISDVVLKKFRQDIWSQTVTIGMDYGPVICYHGDDDIADLFFAGKSMETAKMLSEIREDGVAISDDIYVNLTEDMQKNLFAEEDEHEGVKYRFAPLINIRMRRWVSEGK